MNRVDRAIRNFFAEMDDTDFEDVHLSVHPESDRHFDVSEQDALSADARGYLIALQRRGQITRIQMELIIHYAVTFQQSQMTRLELETLVDRLFFTAEGDLDYEPGNAFPGKPH